MTITDTGKAVSSAEQQLAFVTHISRNKLWSEIERMLWLNDNLQVDELCYYKWIDTNCRLLESIPNRTNIIVWKTNGKKGGNYPWTLSIWYYKISMRLSVLYLFGQVYSSVLKCICYNLNQWIKRIVVKGPEIFWFTK